MTQHLAKEFAMKTLGRCKFFLGIEVAHSKKEICIYQVYTSMLACKPLGSPIDPNHKLGNVEEVGVVAKKMYRKLVRRSIYLFHTRSDIAYVVSVVS